MGGGERTRLTPTWSRATSLCSALGGAGICGLGYCSGAACWGQVGSAKVAWRVRDPGGGAASPAGKPAAGWGRRAGGRRPGRGRAPSEDENGENGCDSDTRPKQTRIRFGGSGIMVIPC
jgi:hypothetical protein